MITSALGTTALTLGLFILFFGMFKLIYVPLALVFEIRADYRRRARRTHTLLDERPSVTIVVPGYNEGPVIENCVRSIVTSNYPHLNVILVDDGSTDETYKLMQELAAEHAMVQACTQPNQGKGAALNTGAKLATGDVLLFVDADGIFTANTVEEMLRGFDHPKVGAVCGDDRPVNLDRVQTRFLTVISHVGTGLVRRALHMLRCLPIVSGNIGAFRREALNRTGLLREDTIGEDLELTWRMHAAGYRVNFAPLAVVYAESPSTLHGLWKQRVRWARGLLQTMRIHWRLIGNPKHGTFGLFLLYTAVTMVLMPLAQLLVIPVLGALFALGDPTVVPTGAWHVLLWVGLPLALGLAIYAMSLNRALGDLRHAWTLPLWPVYSLLMNFTLVKGLWLELRGAPQRWNKLERTGVVSVVEAKENMAILDVGQPVGSGDLSFSSGWR